MTAPSPRARRTRARRTRAASTADAPARNLTEAQFQRQVTDLLTAFKWRWTHNPDSRMVQGHKGVPDLLAVRAGRILAIELKEARGRLSAAQREWLDDLRAAGAEVHVWWASSGVAGLEHIAEVLR